MSLISIRLPEELDAQLNREAETSRRPKSEVARQAIVEYLARRERERFLGAIARAARAARAEGEDPLAIAEEALPLDNEALALAEQPRVQEKRVRYRAPRSQR
jgi:predicted transcriptional regulator